MNPQERYEARDRELREQIVPDQVMASSLKSAFVQLCACRQVYSCSMIGCTMNREPLSTSELVSWPRGSQHNSRAWHPGWLRCSSLRYSRYPRSSRLAIRAPRSGINVTIHAARTLTILPDDNERLETFEAVGTPAIERDVCELLSIHRMQHPKRHVLLCTQVVMAPDAERA
jgi:hypothetical protein